MGFLSLFIFALVLSVARCDVPIVIPPFSCPALPTPPPATDAKHIRPGNIKAIMAMGDSITAGFAMLGFPPSDFLEWRDYGYSTGGKDGAITLANWLLNYSPNLQGMSYEPTLPLTKGAYLDAAVSMARVEMLPPQLAYLVEELQTTYASTVDFDKDWKLLTLFIGANNLCDACRTADNRGTPKFFEDHLRIILKLIDQHIPRVFVNLVTIFNISGVWDAGQTRDYCRVLWDGVTNGECGCLLTGNATDRLAMDIASVEFNKISEQVAQEMSNVSSDFNVVVQPGLSDINIAKMGEIYLSGLDCFHPSLMANEAFTYSLWNNMFTPPGQKATWPDPYNVTIKCPTADDFLQ